MTRLLRSWYFALRQGNDTGRSFGNLGRTFESFAVPAVGLRELAAASLLGWSNYQLGRYLGRESQKVLRGKVFTAHRGDATCVTSVPGFTKVVDLK